MTGDVSSQGTAEAVRGFVEHVAKVADAFAWQAGVGGMETAGGIISYLANHPEHIDAFRNGGIFDLPPDWIENGSLTWHARNGKIVHPSHVRRARVIKRMERGQETRNDRPTSEG